MDAYVVDIEPKFIPKDIIIRLNEEYDQDIMIGFLKLAIQQDMASTLNDVLRQILRELT